MASIYKRGKTWTANVLLNVGGIKKRKTKSGFRTKSEANKWAIETEAMKLNNPLTTKDGIIADLFLDWYQVFKEPVLETNSKNTYKRTLLFLNTYFEYKKIGDITSKDFQKAINDYGKRHVKSTVSHVKNIIGAFVRYAIDEDYIIKDFTRNVTVVSTVSSKDVSLKFLENDELERLTETIKDNQATTSKMIITGIYSGARFSEVAALTRDDFDFKSRTISINKAWQEIDREFKATKTKTSNRIVDIPESFFELIQHWTFGDRFAFESDTGKPPTNAAVNKQLARYLKKENCKIITFHGLRHTHASFLLSHDISVQYISERLGHSNINITMNTYAHLLDKKRHLETERTLNILDNL